MDRRIYNESMFQANRKSYTSIKQFDCCLIFSFHEHWNRFSHLLQRDLKKPMDINANINTAHFVLLII